MTREEFEKAYADGSGATAEDFMRELGVEARPCACGEEGCEGWQMVINVREEDWPKDSPFPKSDPRFQEPQ
jgi:hypothetical protein